MNYSTPEEYTQFADGMVAAGNGEPSTSNPNIDPNTQHGMELRQAWFDGWENYWDEWEDSP